MKKHIVFVLGSYYPNYSAVGKCLGNIADILEKDYKITVVSIQTKYKQKDEECYKNQKILRIKTDYHEKRILIDEKLFDASGISKKFYKAYHLYLRFKGLLKTLLSRSSIEDTLVREYLHALIQISEPIDVLIPTCIPFESVAASIEFKKKNPRVEIIPYLFDLFAANENLNRFHFNKILKKKNNMKLEEQMLNISKKVFHVSNWTAYLRSEFPEYMNKTVEVEHPLLTFNVNEDNNSICKQDNKIHIVYTGILDSKIRNPEFSLNVLAQVDSNVVVDFYSFGSGNSIVEKFAEDSNGKIISHGKVTSFEAEQARANGNILLSIGNEDTSQIPSKLFEYIATGKAIIHIAASGDDPAIELLENYPAKIIIEKNKDFDIEVLNRFIMENRNNLISFDTIINIYYRAYPNNISKMFTDFINMDAEISGGGIK